ncbi:type II secretion system protein GspL [Congregibacter litoralis]|uniref:Type II secretion system protein L n=1 Tax=Congregibacter litoralis KT71 TaxID=314285 RepID=A4A5K5_9GAMM|nr:type II secretion system protein GspL [Congregibacter litoralis]EAQ99076.1 type II secretion system protein L (GspL) [Congregibacter litoralis KT71]
MNKNLSVICLREDQLFWLDAGVLHALDEDGARERLSLCLGERDHGIVFAAPGGDVRLQALTVSPEEKKHLEASLPFMLEESLTDNIEDVHFARRAVDKTRYGVGMVDKQLMHHWETQLDVFARQVPWIPEPLLLPWSAGEWTLVIEAETTLLRYGLQEGTRVENSLLPALLGALRDDAPPERVLVYGEQDAVGENILAALEDLDLQWRRGGLEEALLLSEDGRSQLNLLQGEFAPQLPYGRWWREWRAIAALLLLALSVHLASGWLDLKRLQRENLVLRQEIETVYRGINPRGAIVDAEKQLRRQLDGLRGGATGGTFTGLLAPLGAALSPQEDTVLASLSYSQRNAELRVNLLTANFAEVESLRGSLEAAGLSASLESSSRSGDRVRARLRIGERP